MTEYKASERREKCVWRESGRADYPVPPLKCRTVMMMALPFNALYHFAYCPMCGGLIIKNWKTENWKKYHPYEYEEEK